MPDFPPLDYDAMVRAAVDPALALPRKLTRAEQDAEIARCKLDVVYFVNRYCQIYDNDTRKWIPFKLWPFQERELRELSAFSQDGISWLYPRAIILKARQEGYTWLLGLAQKLWKMLFYPITEVLFFSQAEDDALAAISDQRLRGMYEQLPDWMKLPVKTSSAHEFRLSNGSGIRALPAARGGDSRTVTDVVADEADLIDNLDDLISRAEPTLGEKGQFIIIGRAVKAAPNSSFKRRYRAAKAAMLSGEDALWNKALFSPWYRRTAGRTNFIARIAAPPSDRLVRLSVPSLGSYDGLAPNPNVSYPSRILNTRTGDIRTVTMVTAEGWVETIPAFDQWRSGDELISMAWKDRTDREARATTFTLDSVYEQYPHTDIEALQASSLDKRYAPGVISALYRERRPIAPANAPRLPGLRIYFAPEPGRRYGIGMDPAGGLTDGDDAGLQILAADSLEQVAVLQNKIEPTQFGNYGYELQCYYNNAPILFEFNNHGGELYKQLKERGAVMVMGESRKGQKERTPGWWTSERSKNTLYDTGASAFEAVIAETRDEEGDLRPDLVRPILFDAPTADQLSAVDKNTLKAPDNEHDDLAVAYVLAMRAVYRGVSDMTQASHDLWQAPAPLPGGAPTRAGRGKWLPVAGESEAVINAKLKARGLL